MTSDGKRAVTITLGDYNISKRSQISVWNLEQGKLDEFASFESSAGRENAWPVLFAQGSRLLYGNQIWDISTNSPKIIAEFTQLPPKPMATAVTDDGQLLALATWDGNVSFDVSIYNVGGSVDKPVATGKYLGLQVLSYLWHSVTTAPDWSLRLMAVCAGSATSSMETSSSRSACPDLGNGTLRPMVHRIIWHQRSSPATAIVSIFPAGVVWENGISTKTRSLNSGHSPALRGSPWPMTTATSSSITATARHASCV